MAIDAERLIINLSADFKKFERDMRKASEIGEKQFRSIEKSAERTQAKLKGFSLGGLGGLTKGLGVLSAGFLGVQGARQIAEYAANYVNLQNSLKVTGLEGKALGDVFKQLTEISLRQGAPLDALVTLYSRASQSAKELNASQGELIKFSDGIATALRVAGTSAGEAQGALLQLGQALGAGVVRAEEFNSVNEGARPILQAVANGLKEAGGSVSTLRGLVLDGKISSEAFFRAFLAGSGELRKQADLTAPTVSQSMERIKTAMTVLVGELDKTVKGSESAADALNAVAAVIEAMPGFIDNAVKGFERLSAYLDGLDKHSFFGTLREALKYDPAKTPGYVSQILPPRNVSIPMRPQPGATTPLPDSVGSVGAGGQGGAGAKGLAKVTDYRALKVTADAIVSAGTSAAAMASASGGAKVSIEDFAVAASAAAGKISAIDTEVASITGDVTSSYVNNVVAAESGGKTNAKNPNSTATGLGQFIESTWIDLFKKNFPELAKGKADGDILKLRSDAAISKQLIEAYAKENAAVLTKAGVSVNEAALHLSHFLGAGDAAKVLSAKSGTPLQGLISQASINANPTILGGGRTVDDAKAYAERRATGTRQAAGNFTPSEEAAKERVKDYQDLVAGSVQYIASQQGEAAAIGKTSLEAAKLAHEQDLLNQASQAGLEITPELKAQISQLAGGMAEAEVAANNLAAANQMSQQQIAEWRDFGADAVKGLVSDLIAGKDAGEAFGNVLANIGQKLLDMAVDNLFENLFSGGGKGGGGFNLFGSIGKLFGFASGGYTGSGGKNDPAGIVHKGEYVIPKSVVDRVGVRNVERLMQGYAEGGLVGRPVSMRAPSMPGSSSGSAPSITIGGASIIIQGDANEKTIAETRKMLRDYDKGTVARVAAANREASRRSIKNGR